MDGPIKRECRYCTNYHPNDEQGGSCRKESPAGFVCPTFNGAPQIMGLWPPVQATAWCSRFEKRAEAVEVDLPIAVKDPGPGRSN